MAQEEFTEAKERLEAVCKKVESAMKVTGELVQVREMDIEDFTTILLSK